MDAEDILSLTAGTIGGFFSLLGSLFIITVYLKFRIFSDNLFSLVFGLSVADFLASITILLQIYIPLIFKESFTVDVFYTVIDVLWYLAIASGFIWSSFVALYNFRTLRKILKRRWVCNLLAWGIPLFGSLILLFGSSDASLWLVHIECYVDSPARVFNGECDPSILQPFLGVTFAFAWAFNVGTYIAILIKRRKSKKSLNTLDTAEPVGREETLLHSTGKTHKVASYILIFIICFSPLFLAFFLNFQPTKSKVLEKIVSLSTAFLVPLQGLLNAIAYGLNSSIRLALRQSLMNKNNSSSAKDYGAVMSSMEYKQPLLVNHQSNA